MQGQQSNCITPHPPLPLSVTSVWSKRKRLIKKIWFIPKTSNFWHFCFQFKIFGSRKLGGILHSGKMVSLWLNMFASLLDIKVSCFYYYDCLAIPYSLHLKVYIFDFNAFNVPFNCIFLSAMKGCFWNLTFFGFTIFVCVHFIIIIFFQSIGPPGRCFL